MKHLQIPRLLKDEFLGNVVDNNDPAKQFRIKVLIPGIFELPSNPTKEQIDTLPFVYPQDYASVAQKYSPNFISPVPQIGSVVVVYFPDITNIYFPVYRSDNNSNDKSYINTFKGDSYPNVWGFTDWNNNTIICDGKQNIITISTAGKTPSIITIDAKGSISVQCSDINIKTQSAELTSNSLNVTCSASVFTGTVEAKDFISSDTKFTFNKHKHNYIPGQGSPTDTSKPDA